MKPKPKQKLERHNRRLLNPVRRRGFNARRGGKRREAGEKRAGDPLERPHWKNDKEKGKQKKVIPARRLASSPVASLSKPPPASFLNSFGFIAFPFCYSILLALSEK